MQTVVGDSAKTNLLSFEPAALTDWVAGIGQKPFRAKQLLQWLHQRTATDFSVMTDLAKDFRAQLESVACIQTLPILKDHLSADGTRKWLLDAGQNNAIETVYIPEDDRGTLCVSSQAGCTVACRFCSTGHQGFARNLTTDEIIGQLHMANRLLDTQVTNVVMMGMGEPLLNFDALVPALQLMLDDNAYGLSRRRVTVSTSGVVPMMDRLAQACPVALAVSLHAPTDTLRDDLVPINKKYPLAELMAACRRYLQVAPRDFITFEYVMLDGVNDQPEQAWALIDLVRSHDVYCKFNLIPFNPFPQSGLKASPRSTIRQFATILSDAGIVTTIRKTRGDDIDAACGQLAGEIKDKTQISGRMAAQRQEQPVRFQSRGRP